MKKLLLALMFTTTHFIFAMEMDAGKDLSAIRYDAQTQHLMRLFQQLEQDNVSCKNTQFYNAIRALIQNGADVNVRDELGCTPLMHVSSISNPITQQDIARRLLAKDADVNARDKEGNTPLIYACKSRRNTVALIQLFIKHGAEVNHQNDQALSPLMVATTYTGATSLNKMKILLEHNANILQANLWGFTPFQLAVNVGKLDKIQLFYDHIQAFAESVLKAQAEEVIKSRSNSPRKSRKKVWELFQRMQAERDK